jgi:hypothetical protein
MKHIIALILLMVFNINLKSQIISGDSLIWENSDKSIIEIMDEVFEAFDDSILLPFNVLADLERGKFLLSHFKIITP